MEMDSLPNRTKEIKELNTVAKKREIEIGAKFDKLTVQSFALSYNERLCICRCDCGQIVPATGKSLQANNKQQCVECDERVIATKFQSGDVVIVRLSQYAALCEEQAIITGFAEIEKRIWIKAEFRGRDYFCKPSQLEFTGRNFNK